MAMAPRARARNRRSIRATAPEVDAARLAVDIETPERRSGPEAEGLLQIVPFRARGFNWSAGVAGPLDHRAGVKPCFSPAEQLMHDKPVGRSPVTGVAVARHRARWHCMGNHRKFLSRLQTIARLIVELGAVDIHGSGDMAISLNSRCFFLAEEKRGRARVHKRDPTLAFGRFDFT